jgi:hypothetical protein
MITDLIKRSFVHANGANWWGPSKNVLVMSLIIQLLVIAYMGIKKSNQFGIWTVLSLANLLPAYFITLTASCLKSSKCSYIAWFWLILLILYMIGELIVIYFIIGKNGEFFEIIEEEEL